MHNDKPADLFRRFSAVEDMSYNGCTERGSRCLNRPPPTADGRILRFRHADLKPDAPMTHTFSFIEA
jgi:hypothetical protein